MLKESAWHIYPKARTTVLWWQQRWKRQQCHSDSRDRVEEHAKRIYKLISEMNSWKQAYKSKASVFDMSTAMSGTPITQGRGNSEVFPRLGSQEWHYHLSGGPCMDVNSMFWGHSFLFLDDCSLTLLPYSDLLLRWVSPPPQSAANGKPSSLFSCIKEGWWVSGPWGIFIIAHSPPNPSISVCMSVILSLQSGQSPNHKDNNSILPFRPPNTCAHTGRP